MKFQKKLDLWEPGVQEKILADQVKLQPGQWLTCGKDNDRSCIYVGHNGQTINVVHWQGSQTETLALYRARRKKS